MTKEEIKMIGKVMARELYHLYQTKGVPVSDYMSAEEVCSLLKKSRQWLYAHNADIPHNKGLYLRSAVESYINQ
jgi:hypothetical protein